jgi:hypothetical protein
MLFHKNMRAAPYNTPLLLRHKKNGIGIGVLRKQGNLELEVSYACFRDSLGGLHVTMPLPTRFEDLDGWSAELNDKPLEEMSVTLPGLIRIRDAAKHSSVHHGEMGMTINLEEITSLADELIGKISS